MPANESSPSFLKGWRLRAFILVLIVSILGYLLFALWGGWREVLAAMSRVGWRGMGIALGLSLLNYGLRFIRWQHYLNILACQVPMWESLKIYIAGFALTTTPAKAGEMMRSLFLKNYGMRYHASFGAFLSERVSDLLAILLLAAVGLFEHAAARPICISTGIVIAAALLIVQQKSWLRAFQRWAIRNLSKRAGGFIYFFVKILLAFRDCFSLPTLLWGTLLGFLAWGAEGVAFYYILQGLGSDLDWLTSVFIYSFSLLVGAITFLPGGLGAAELTMWQLLQLYGVRDADIVAATVLIRLATLWFAVLLGLLSLSAISLKKPQPDSEA